MNSSVLYTTPLRRDEEANTTVSVRIDPAVSRSMLRPLSPRLFLNPKSTPRVLVVDDDPIFEKIIQRAASKERIPVTTCRTVEDLAALPALDFDVVVVDYALGPITGVELVRYFEQVSGSPPVVLISNHRHLKSTRWPLPIRDFVHKALGPFAILDAAFEAYELNKIELQMKRKKGLS